MKGILKIKEIIFFKDQKISYTITYIKTFKDIMIILKDIMIILYYFI